MYFLVLLACSSLAAPGGRVFGLPPRPSHSTEVDGRLPKDGLFSSLRLSKKVRTGVMGHASWAVHLGTRI